MSEPEPVKKICDNCYYYRGDDTSGFCVRVPPRIVRGQRLAQFPRVESETACGRWRVWDHDFDTFYEEEGDTEQQNKQQKA